jgi:hypothetical protein
LTFSFYYAMVFSPLKKNRGGDWYERSYARTDHTGEYE